LKVPRPIPCLNSISCPTSGATPQVGPTPLHCWGF